MSDARFNIPARTIPISPLPSSDFAGQYTILASYSSAFCASRAVLILSVSISYPNTFSCIAQPVTVLCDSNAPPPPRRLPIACKRIDAINNGRDKSRHRSPPLHHEHWVVRPSNPSMVALWWHYALSREACYDTPKHFCLQIDASYPRKYTE